MIKHEETERKHILTIIIEDIRKDMEQLWNNGIDSKNYVNETTLEILEQYIEQQQKKDELLELYREKDNHIENWENYDRSLDMGYIAKLEYLQEKIKALEEELK